MVESRIVRSFLKKSKAVGDRVSGGSAPRSGSQRVVPLPQDGCAVEAEDQARQAPVTKDKRSETLNSSPELAARLGVLLSTLDGRASEALSALAMARRLQPKDRRLWDAELQHTLVQRALQEDPAAAERAGNVAKVQGEAGRSRVRAEGGDSRGGGLREVRGEGLT